MTEAFSRTERRDLWRRARTLDGVPEQARSPRARLLARRLRPVAPAMDWRAVAQAPVWSGWSITRRRRLAIIAGAVLMSQRLAATIDGRILGALGAAIGEEALDQVLRLTPQERPETPPLTALDPQTLEGLGAAALMAGQSRPVASRLAHDMAAPALRLEAGQAASARDHAIRIAEATP